MELLLIVTIVAAAANSMLLHKIPKGHSILTFNLICSFVWVVLLFITNGFEVSFTKNTILFGCLYGGIQMLFLLFKSLAMNTGPVSVTTIIGNCSLVLSTVVSIIVWREAVSYLQIIGICVLVAAFFLCTHIKGSTRATRMWIIYCVLFFVCSAGVGITFKAFSKSEPDGAATGDMMLIAAFVMLIFLSAASLASYARKRRSGGAVPSKWKWSTVLIALLCGVLSCGYNRLNITLSGILPGAVFYPCFNGGVCFLSTLLGILIFKERLSKIQTAGLAIGLCAVVIIGIA